MTKQEMLQKYNVPPDLFDKYEAAHKCTGFTDKDVENMSLILTLYDAGFDDAEVRDYIGFYRSGGDTAEKRTEMLLKKRKKALEELHAKQEQLDRIDYLRYKIKKENKG